MREKRSSSGETARSSLQQDLFPQGVGARHTPPAPSPRGGEYQKTCTAPEFCARPPDAEKKRDPRLVELERLGLHAAWMAVAEEIGVDSFLAMWRILDGHEAFRHKLGFLQIHLKLYRSYTRYQRNQYIRALAAHGHDAVSIRRALIRQFREPMSLRNISRLMGADRL